MQIVSICMECQILFWGKNKKKYFNKSSAENVTQSAESDHNLNCLPLGHMDLLRVKVYRRWIYRSRFIGGQFTVYVTDGSDLLLNCNAPLTLYLLSTTKTLDWLTF